MCIHVLIMHSGFYHDFTKVSTLLEMILKFVFFWEEDVSKKKELLTEEEQEEGSKMDKLSGQQYKVPYYHAYAQIFNNAHHAF